MQIFKNPNYDFVRWKWHAIALSWVIILAGGLFIWKKGMPKGVEFSGGTIVIIKFEQHARPRQDPRGAAGRRRQRRRPELRPAGAEAGDDPRAGRRRRVGRLAQRRRPTPSSRRSTRPGSGRSAARARRRSRQLRRRTEIVGPTVGKELARRGILAMVFALGGILVYIALRFRLSFAVGAVVATIHDLLITLAFLALVQVRAEPQRHRGAADDHRLLDERHHRHLRPRPREHAHRCGATTSPPSSTPPSTRCWTAR